MDYIPRRLAPLSRLPCLPTEVLQRIMMFCDFESLSSLSCTKRHLLSLPHFKWFQIKLFELELASIDPWRHKTHLNNFSDKPRTRCRCPCYSCLQAFHRPQFPFVFWDWPYALWDPRQGRELVIVFADRTERSRVQPCKTCSGMISLRSGNGDKRLSCGI